MFLVRYSLDFRTRKNNIVNIEQGLTNDDFRFFLARKSKIGITEFILSTTPKSFRSKFGTGSQRGLLARSQQLTNFMFSLRSSSSLR